MNDELMDVKTHRRCLHEIPELSYDLPKTHAYLEAVLTSYGYQTQTVAQSGLVAVKKGQLKEGIAFRADMDALPIHENNIIDYASIHPGHMHACGHDGHMAMVLGFAKRLADKTPKQTVMFVFEPAEETYGGAKDIVETGVFKTHNIKAIFALHLDPELEEGKIGYTEGIMTTQDGDFDIDIIGKNAHGTMPHQGQDAILAASQLIQQYHTIIARSIDPLKSTSINIGTMHAGDSRNVIASHVSINGSIRAFDFHTYETLKRRMRQIDQGIANSYQVTIKNNITDLHPPVYNDQQLVDRFIESFSVDDIVPLKPMMLAEDFSYYQQIMPGLFLMLGTKNSPKGFNYPLHSSYFNFDETVLIKGIDVFEKLLLMMG